jgi:uncharacterized membrane protein YjdF
MKEQRRVPRSVLVLTIAYMAAAVVGVAATGNREFLVYLAVVATAAGVVFALHRRVEFSPAVLCGISLLGAAHMAGGLVRPPEGWPIDGRQVLYNLWLIPDRLKFDQVVHFSGSVVGTCACWQWLRASAGVTRPTYGLVAICVLAGSGLGAINEAVEFLTTRVVSETNVGGFENTGWDLVANLAGTAAAGLLILGSARFRADRGRWVASRPVHTASTTFHPDDTSGRRLRSPCQ